MNTTTPTVSVIIPVYNGELYMRDCLAAVLAQTTPAKEVIVVDNNCTDGSMRIARQFKRVTIVKEKRQGQSFARNTGYDVATGDIFLRIDTDTILPNDHIETLVRLATQYPNIAGFTGYGISRYEFIPKLSIPWSWGYFTFTHAYLGYPQLWGANIAIRRSYWKKLHPWLINDDTAVHEDQDLTLALVSVGGRVKITRELTVSVQMEGLLHFSKYRKYGHMLQLLKELDKEHERYNLATRLPKTNILKRLVYWLASVWGVYLFYGVTFIYSVYCRLKHTVVPV